MRGSSGVYANKMRYKAINFLFQNKCIKLACFLNQTFMEKNINRIKVVLADKRRSNKWLSEQLGVAPTTVSKWCTNSCQPPMETFIRIAQLLEVDLNELVRYE